jgi:hypothetical protein
MQNPYIQYATKLLQLIEDYNKFNDEQLLEVVEAISNLGADIVYEAECEQTSLKVKLGYEPPDGDEGDYERENN